MLTGLADRALVRCSPPVLIQDLVISKKPRCHPVQPDSVTFYAYRPSDAARDFSVPMERQTKGLYSAKAQFVDLAKSPRTASIRASNQMERLRTILGARRCAA